MYNYLPRNEDELELKEGDIVDVMEKCDDGWFVGKRSSLPMRKRVLSIMGRIPTFLKKQKFPQQYFRKECPFVHLTI